MAHGACLILIAVSLIVIRILLRLKDLNKSVISLRGPKRFSGWFVFSLGIYSLGGPQGSLVVCVWEGMDFDGRAGKFSLLGVGGLTVALGAGVEEGLGVGLVLAVLIAST